jgi:4a-hydroxytetrahydrobiopterin dehydratase
MNWEIENDILTKEFEFNNFIEAVLFVNKISSVSEKVQHHPDILIHSYKKVKIMLFSHSENKITERDYELAKMIDGLI